MTIDELQHQALETLEHEIQVIKQEQAKVSDLGRKTALEFLRSEVLRILQMTKDRVLAVELNEDAFIAKFTADFYSLNLNDSLERVVALDPSQQKPNSSTKNEDKGKSVIVNYPKPLPPATFTCIACRDNHPLNQRLIAPCLHPYCLPCVASLARSSLTGGPLPARCCSREMPVDYMRVTLSITEYSLYAQRLATVRDTGLLSDLEYKNSCSRLGYKQCARCGVGIERNGGCTHVTCKCGYDFQYC
jgi:hypothetical protein